MFSIEINKKIYIIAELYCGHIHGSFIDCLDIYYNLKSSGYLCNLIILIHLQYVKSIMKRLSVLYTPNLCNDIIKHFSNNIDNINPNDTIICKYESIKNSIIDYNKYKNIYIINDWLLTSNFISKTAIDFDNIKNIRGIIGTPFLRQYTNKLIIDYIKFNKFRLNNIKVSYKLGTFNQYDKYDILKKQQYFNIHNYNRLIYKRRKLEEFPICMEMKGKLIFEFLYFGKQVHYSPINKQFDDGLTDYLSLFNIDDNKEQDLNISKEEIFDKLINKEILCELITP